MYSVQQDRKARASRILAAFISEVERIVSIILEDAIVLRITEHDQLKLYQLQIWSWRYKVSVEFILNTLLHFWQERMPRHFKRRKGALGIRVSTLVGIKSKNYLLYYIGESFPNGENEAEWRINYVMSIVPSAGQRDILVSSPIRFMKEYTARIAKSRQRIADTRVKFSRRAFRDNPFTS